MVNGASSQAPSRNPARANIPLVVLRGAVYNVFECQCMDESTLSPCPSSSQTFLAQTVLPRRDKSLKPGIATMAQRNGWHREEENPSFCVKRSSVMEIASVLNDSGTDHKEPLHTNQHRKQQTDSRLAQFLTQRAVHPSQQGTMGCSASAINRPRVWSLSTQPSRRVGSPVSPSGGSKRSLVARASSPRRANRPKYSAEEEAFIWFHRVDLDQEWDTVVFAFNNHFRHSHHRDKSGLECKLYRVLSRYGIPQIREWRRRGNRMVQEVTTYHGIVETTHIRYPWMGPRHWPPQDWP